MTNNIIYEGSSKAYKPSGDANKLKNLHVIKGSEVKEVQYKKLDHVSQYLALIPGTS